MADTIYGRSLQEARRFFAMRITAVGVNQTQTQYAFLAPVGMGKWRVEGVYWTSTASLSDADGTILVSVFNRDVSEGADDTLVNAQSIEGGTANAIAAFTLAAEGSEKEFTIDEGDAVRIAITNNSAAIDTNGAVCIWVVAYPIPNDETGPGVQRLSAY